MKKVLYIDSDLCTGCLRCELACSFRHYEEFNPVKSRIRVAALERRFFPMTCAMCDEAPCEISCPAGAYYRDEKGNVMLDDSKCIGCRICMLACPFGAVSYLDGKVIKCDLCGYDPECVNICPTEAIKFVDVSTAAHLERAKAAARTGRAVNEAVA